MACLAICLSGCSLFHAAIFSAHQSSIPFSSAGLQITTAAVEASPWPVACASLPSSCFPDADSPSFAASVFAVFPDEPQAEILAASKVIANTLETKLLFFIASSLLSINVKTFTYLFKKISSRIKIIHSMPYLPNTCIIYSFPCYK